MQVILLIFFSHNLVKDKLINSLTVLSGGKDPASGVSSTQHILGMPSEWVRISIFLFFFSYFPVTNTKYPKNRLWGKPFGSSQYDRPTCSFWDTPPTAANLTASWSEKNPTKAKVLSQFLILISQMTAIDGNHRVMVWRQFEIPTIKQLLVLPYDKDGVRMTLNEFRVICQGTNWMQSNNAHLSMSSFYISDFLATLEHIIKIVSLLPDLRKDLATPQAKKSAPTGVVYDVHKLVALYVPFQKKNSERKASKWLRVARFLFF